MTMADCLQCSRCRPKGEEHLAGLVECKATDDASQLLTAFYEFAKARTVSVPFAVTGGADSTAPAWPLQFNPASITQCEGFISNGGRDGLA